MEYNEKELIEKAQKGDSDALEQLLIQNKVLVKQISRVYFLVGAEPEDLIQEGMIGLYKACLTYNGKSSFNTFAKICISRKIKSAIKTATRKKNIPLNKGISLNSQGGIATDFDDEENDCTIIPSNDLSPEEKLIVLEQHKQINEIINNELSQTEKNILLLYLDGLTYNEIANKTNTTSKSVENALLRARKKITNKLN